ncbi:MAG: hypothetical protein QW041_01925 [Candidatus Pacearchaeota archaeon]
MPIKKDSNLWLIPPRIKILEALGTIADKRIEIKENKAKVKSSTNEKTYSVTFDGKKAITSNDNGSFYKGYLGYPSIAFLMLKGILPYDEKIAQSLQGIKWKELNEKIKNYFKVELIVKTIASRKGVKQNQIDEFISKVMKKIKELKFEKLE